MTKVGGASLITAGVIAVAVLAAASTRVPIVVLAVIAALGFAALAWHKPLVAASSWLGLLVIVPSWWVVSAPGIGEIGVVSSLGLILATVLALTGRNRSGGEVGFAVVAVALLTVVFIGLRFFELPGYLARDYVFVFIIPAFIGLRLGHEIGKLLPVLGALAGAWALVEFALDWHIFENLPPITSWSSIQYRGGFPRSETSFGTPIALGTFLSLTIPFIRTMSRGHLLATVLILGGIVVTFTRSGIITAVITIAVCVWLAPARYRSRSVGLLVLTTIAGVITSSLLSNEVASADTAGSTAYRVRAIVATFGSMRPIGLTQSAVVDPESGSLRYAGYNSIDNAFLLNGLVLGYVPLILLTLLLGVLVWQVLKRTAGDAGAAIVGQIFAMATVALLTHWQFIFFLVVGMAIRETLDRRARSSLSSNLARSHSAERLAAGSPSA